MKRPSLVPEWRRAWRWLSMQVAALAVVYGALPQESQAAVLEAVGVPSHRITLALGLLFMVTRLVSQKPKDAE